MFLMPSPKAPKHSTGWRVLRRASDWAFRYAIPGKHHTLDNSLIALMVAREMRP